MDRSFEGLNDVHSFERHSLRPAIVDVHAEICALERIEVIVRQIQRLVDVVPRGVVVLLF